MDKQTVSAENDPNLPVNTSIQTCFAYFANDYDDDNGGFGTRPKFPQPGIFNLDDFSLGMKISFSEYELFINSCCFKSSSERKS
jgi:hypothetical protein